MTTNCSRPSEIRSQADSRQTTASAGSHLSPHDSFRSRPTVCATERTLPETLRSADERRAAPRVERLGLLVPGLDPAEKPALMESTSTPFEEAERGVRRPRGLPWSSPQYIGKFREFGRDEPSQTHSMIGLRRMTNLQSCVEQALAEGVPGQLIETGV